MKRTLLFCGVVLASAVTQALGANATFSIQTYPILGNTQVAADFNGDGKLDLAGNAGNKAASVMLNNGNGSFAPRVEFPIGFWTQDVGAGDFNGDGKADLVVTLQDPQFSLAFLPGTGTGSFGPATFFQNPTGFDAPYVLTSDINNDGKLDVVIMNSLNCFTASCTSARTLVVMLGNGNGTFQPGRVINAGTYPTAIALGDFNRDGIKDLAVGGANTELSILIGVGDGSFVPKPLMLLVPGGDVASTCNDVDVADFNRDGIQDIVAPLGNGYGNVVALGNGDGTFRVFTRFVEEATGHPQSDAIADFNGDGFLDIARGMADGLRGLIHVLHGNGDGTFQPLVRYAVPSTLTNQGGGYIIAGDFNGDTKPDLALEVRGSGATDVFLNTTGSTTTQPTPTLQSLVMNPSSIVVPNWGTGVVTLSGTAQSPTTVQIRSNNSNVTVPTSVTVSTGTRSVSFNIIPKQVSSATSVQITATANNISRSATLTVKPQGSTPAPSPTPPPPPAPSATPAATPAPAADTVSISRAEYETAKRTLRIDASSSKSTATLQAYVTSTNQLIGRLTNNGAGRYSGAFTLSANPQNITVRSNLGGAKSSAVTAK